MKGYPPGFRRWLLLVLAVCFVSGMLLLPTTLAQRAAWPALPWQLPADSRVSVAATHAAAAFVLLWFAGALWAVHMRAGWRRQRQRLTGAVLVAGLGLLAVSALLLYYAGDEQLALAAALLHAGLGLVLAVPMVWHAWGRISRRHGHHRSHAHPRG